MIGIYKYSVPKSNKLHTKKKKKKIDEWITFSCHLRNIEQCEPSYSCTNHEIDFALKWYFENTILVKVLWWTKWELTNHGTSLSICPNSLITSIIVSIFSRQGTIQLDTALAMVFQL